MEILNQILEYLKTKTNWSNADTILADFVTKEMEIIKK